MRSDYTLSEGQIVYVVLPPNNQKPYRYITGKIRRISMKHYYKKYLKTLKVTKVNKPNLKEKIKFIVDSLDGSQNYYLCELNRIYTLDQLHYLKDDISKFNELSQYKKKLEEDYYKYIEENFKGWDCDFKPKF